MHTGTVDTQGPVYRGDEATKAHLPQPTPEFRRRAWLIFQRALDPLGTTRALPIRPPR